MAALAQAGMALAADCLVGPDCRAKLPAMYSGRRGRQPASALFAVLAGMRIH